VLWYLNDTLLLAYDTALSKAYILALEEGECVSCKKTLQSDTFPYWTYRPKGILLVTNEVTTQRGRFRSSIKIWNIETLSLTAAIDIPYPVIACAVTVNSKALYGLLRDQERDYVFSYSIATRRLVSKREIGYLPVIAPRQFLIAADRDVVLVYNDPHVRAGYQPPLPPLHILQSWALFNPSLQMELFLHYLHLRVEGCGAISTARKHSCVGTTWREESIFSN